MPKWSALNIVCMYAILSSLWVVFINTVIDSLFSGHPQLLFVISLVKGWCYVAIISLILLYILGKFEQQFKQQAQSLQLSEAYYKSVLDNIIDVYFRADINNKIIKASPSALTLLGYSSMDSIIGQNILSFWAFPEERAHILKELALHGEVRDYEVAVRRADGTTIIVSTSSRYYTDETGAIAGIEGLIHDISERKRAEHELRLAKDRAEAASMAKSVFLANMNHEIRTPLNGILGMLQLLQTSQLNTSQQEYVELAINSSRRLAKLLADILDLSRIETGSLELTNTEFSLEALRNTVVDLLCTSAQEKGLTFSFIIAEQTPATLIGDELRLAQILFNIIGNAIKFTDAGEVRVEVYPTSMLPGEARLLFAIRDTGIGISDEQLQEIFKPFTQVEHHVTRKYQGAGLGLSLVQRLLELMKGSLAVDNGIEGGGTIFYVSLPFGLPVTRAGTNYSGKIVMDGLSCPILLAEEVYARQGHAQSG